MSRIRKIIKNIFSKKECSYDEIYGEDTLHLRRNLHDQAFKWLDEMQEVSDSLKEKLKKKGYISDEHNKRDY